jgi:hypothetical protein
VIPLDIDIEPVQSLQQKTSVSILEFCLSPLFNMQYNFKTMLSFQAEDFGLHTITLTQTFCQQRLTSWQVQAHVYFFASLPLSLLPFLSHPSFLFSSLLFSPFLFMTFPSSSSFPNFSHSLLSSSLLRLHHLPLTIPVDWVELTSKRFLQWQTQILSK